MKDAPAQPGLELALPEMMREVSCRALGVVLDAVETRGISLEDWLGKVPVTEERLRDLNQWISWDTFVQLLDNLRERLPGGDAELVDIGYENFGTTSFDFMRRIASFIVRPRDLYWMGTTWFGPTLFTMVEDRFEDLPNGQLCETLTVPPEREGCRPLFLIMEGAMRRAPGLVGRPDSEVKLELDAEGRRAVYTIKPPPRAALSTMFRVFGRGLLGGKRFVEELSEQQTQLKDSRSRLCAANQVVDEQAWRLRTVDRIGRELARHIELRPLTDAIFRMIEPLLPNRGMALYVQPIHEDQPRHLGRRGRTNEPGARTYPMVIGGARVGRLELWPAADSESDANTSLVEELLPWIAIALDNARAHEAVREYSSALEVRVKETASERDEANGHLESERLERDYLLERLRRTDEKLRLVEAVGSLNNLGVDIANQIVDPIESIRSAVELAKASRDEPGGEAALAGALERIERSVLSAWGVARGLSLFMHTEPVQKRRTNVNDAVLLAIADAQGHARAAGAAIDVTLSKEPCFGYANAAQIEQVVLSLLRNAIDAVSDQGQITVMTEKLEDGVRIVVKDNGPGIDDTDLERIFELFHSTRRRGGQTGVGLSAARSIVTGDGGSLRAESNEGQGARFVVELPLEPPTTLPDPSEQTDG